MAQWHRIIDSWDETTLYALRDSCRVYAEVSDEPTARQTKELADIWNIDVADGIVDVAAFMGVEG